MAKPKDEKYEKEGRFVVTHDEGSRIAGYGRKYVMVDKETGVNYLILTAEAGFMGGITPLIDADGKPIVTPIES